MKDESCCLCGSTDTHSCGNDHLCDPCCIRHMDSSGKLFDWIQKIIDHSHELKVKLDERHE